MKRRSSPLRKSLVGLLLSGVVGLFLMLALPSLAMADPAVAEPTEAVTPAPEATPTDEATPPVEPAAAG